MHGTLQVEREISLFPLLSADWGYYHISNAMQYSNTALETKSLVMHDSKSFFYEFPLLLMALQTS